MIIKKSPFLAWRNTINKAKSLFGNLSKSANTDKYRIYKGYKKSPVIKIENFFKNAINMGFFILKKTQKFSLFDNDKNADCDDKYRYGWHFLLLCLFYNIASAALPSASQLGNIIVFPWIQDSAETAVRTIYYIIFVWKVQSTLKTKRCGGSHRQCYYSITVMSYY